MTRRLYKCFDACYTVPMHIYYTTETIAGGAFLKKVLALYGAEGEIVRTENGKPYLKNGGAEFSLTHTEGLTAAAIGGQPVGLDAEKRRPRKTDALVSRLSPSERQEDLFELWTAKEAYIKYQGGTLAKDLANLKYKKGVLFYKDAPLGVSIKHFELEGCHLCLCIGRGEEISLVKL